MYLRSAFAFALAATTAAMAFAHDHNTNGVHIEQAYARATVPHQRSGGAYLTIENRGDTADKLVGATSPVAKSVEIHTMSMEGNVMRMREIGEINLPPSARIEMKPGNGYHLMLIDLHQPLKAGESFPMTLVFEKADKREVSVTVRGTNMQGQMHDNAHRGH